MKILLIVVIVVSVVAFFLLIREGLDILAKFIKELLKLINNKK